MVVGSGTSTYAKNQLKCHPVLTRCLPKLSWLDLERRNALKSLAGAGGFEPPNGGIKIRCLTTWLRPTELAFAPAYCRHAGRNIIFGLTPINDCGASIAPGMPFRTAARAAMDQ